MYRLNRFNNACRRCNLSTGNSICGQSEVDFNEVELIVVSAFPGNQEVKDGISLSPGDKNSSKMNAGKFLRLCLHWMFDLDVEVPSELKPFSEKVFYTNAIKCNPQKGQIKTQINNNHLDSCKDWLKEEIDLFNRGQPILLAGSEACKSILGFKESIYNNRGIIHQYKNHPVVVTNNPIEWERGALKELVYGDKTIEDLDKLFSRYKNPKKTFIDSILKSKYWTPIPLGSGLWFAKQDLLKVKQLVLDNYRRAKND
ncbi:hypothetical protein H6G33_10525 [Calothrix sp. FACHB-1219]|uniref:uracil-DNA glycosylase family protein n=1 Tax=unclassified Calothrix TaxID=2619626 RepID=UPI001686765C|nr:MULTISPECIES: uracil-DNA glycosylase family protein [unclassified Calothrix]MBD2201782.1 hypothetical protein [Calothrix sp. FACHB-168]MBD2217468.1 hypothetical protein [Calothrix sp. FACHB-1219]